MGVSWADQTSKEKLSFWSVFSYSMQQQWTIFLIGLWCAMKSGFKITTGEDQLGGWTEKKFQSTFQWQTRTKKRSWSLFGDLLPVWSTTAFWILAKPLHLKSMLSKPKRCTKTVMPGTGIGQQKGPNSPWQCPAVCCTTNASKVEWIGLWSFASSATFTWPLANQLPLLKASQTTFFRENTSTTSRRKKMLSKSLLNPEAWIFMLQE